MQDEAAAASPPPYNCTGGWEGTYCASAISDHFRCVVYSLFCPSSHQFYCPSSGWHLACLVGSFRYNGLATLALAGPSSPRAGPSGPLRALRARRGDCLWTPFGLPLASGRQETFFAVTVTPCNETAPYVRTQSTYTQSLDLCAYSQLHDHACRAHTYAYHMYVCLKDG